MKSEDKKKKGKTGFHTDDCMHAYATSNDNAMCRIHRHGKPRKKASGQAMKSGETQVFTSSELIYIS